MTDLDVRFPDFVPSNEVTGLNLGVRLTEQ